MVKVLGGFIAGLGLISVVIVSSAQSLMFNEYESPFGVEETAARIQANMQSLSGNGWKLSGLRNPAAAVAAAGSNVLPVLLVEGCSTSYSGPLLKDDRTRIFSILMPCTITVYKKDDGKTYIGTMNTGLMGKLFGLGEVMQQVAADQQKIIELDPAKPAPPLIRIRPGGGGAGGLDTGGC